jgi:hypothetical protein
MARTLDINKIKTYTEGIIDDAVELISSVDRELFPGVIEVYQFMADNCRNYYNEFNLQDYTARALVYATSALQLCEAHGIRVAERSRNKLQNTINDLVQFTQNTWYQARDAGEVAKTKKLTDQQKLFTKEASNLVTGGIIVISAFTTGVLAVTAVAAIGISIMAAASVLSLPALMMAGTTIAAFSPHITALAVITLPSIYSVYHDVCELKA